MKKQHARALILLAELSALVHEMVHDDSHPKHKPQQKPELARKSLPVARVLIFPKRRRNPQEEN